MTFLAITSQKSLLTLQKSQLEFEQILVTNQVSWCKKQMDNITKQYNTMNDGKSSADSDYLDVDSDPYFLELQQMDEQLETRMSALNDQTTLLKEQINSFKQLMQNNIKSDCGLNLIGG